MTTVISQIVGKYKRENWKSVPHSQESQREGKYNQVHRVVIFKLCGGSKITPKDPSEEIRKFPNKGRQSGLASELSTTL